MTTDPDLDGVEAPEASADTASPPPEPAAPAMALSAGDRRQTPVETETTRRTPWLWLIGTVVLAVLVGVVYGAVTGADSASQADLLTEAVETARSFRVDVVTDEASRAEAFVIEQFGIPIAAPDLGGLQLLGAGAAELVPGLVVPAFRYDARSGATVVVFAYDYVTLDQARAEGKLVLAPAVYSRLAEPDPVDSRREGDAYVVTWRRRATIYSAVTPGQESAEQILQSVRLSE